MKRLPTSCVAIIPVVVIALILSACERPPVSRAELAGIAPTSAEAALAGGPGLFTFAGWAGPELPIWTYVPPGVDRETAPLVIVMHGTGRDADRYRDEWIAPAAEHGLIVVAPEFGRRDFDGAAGYNLGHVFTEEGVGERPPTLWSFAAIEPLFERVRQLLGSRQSGFTLYGHSAGGQFVHRYLMYMPDAPVLRYLPANAGWYTLPEPGVAYPYGIDGSLLPLANVTAAFGKDVTILLGTHDADPEHPSLRRTPEALAQGSHRLARGLHFVERAQALGSVLGRPVRWNVALIEGAEHSNAQMAVGAAPLVASQLSGDQNLSSTR